MSLLWRVFAWNAAVLVVATLTLVLTPLTVSRIARKLHDEIGQALTAVVLQLERAARDADPPVRGDVQEAREAVRESSEEVREIARRLRPEAPDDLGLGSALAALTLDASRRTGLRIERGIDPDVPALASEEALVVYRVAQEGLTNVARHADAQHAWVTLAGRDGHVTLEVRDDGCGFEPAGAGGAGLRGMRERALLVGAELAVDARPGAGTAVRLTLSGDERS